MNSRWGTGTKGEYLATLILLHGAESEENIGKLFSVGSYKLPESSATLLTLAPKRSLYRAEDFGAEDYDIVPQLKANQIYIPSMRFRPNGIVPLFDAGILQGYLTLQCKQHEYPISWQKFLRDTLASTNPLLCYSGASLKYSEWVRAFNAMDGANQFWIRVSAIQINLRN